MPLGNDYWSFFYESIGIDPFSPDPEDQLNQFSTTFTPEYRGLPATELDVYEGRDDSAFERIAATTMGTIHGTLGSFLGAGADLFDRAQEGIRGLATDPVSTLSSVGRGLGEGVDMFNQGVDFLSGGMLSRAGFDTDAFGGSEPSAPAPATDVGNFLREQQEKQELFSGIYADMAKSPLETGGLVSELQAGGLDLPTWLGGEGGAGEGLSFTEAAELVGTTAGQMVGMGTVGMATGPSGIQAALLRSYAASAFADTYNDKIDDGQSVSAALAAAGANAVIQPALEKIGLDAMFGKGLIRGLSATGLANNRMANAAVKGLEGMLGEAGTEGLQNITDILVRRPDLDDHQNWGKALAAAIEDPSTLESAAMGGLFGGWAGNVSGFFTKPYASTEAKLGAKDVSSRHGGTLSTEQQATEAIAASTLTGQERAQEALTDTLDLQLNNPDQDLTPQISTIADAVLAGQENRTGALQELLLTQEEDRVALAEKLPPVAVDGLGEVFQNSVQGYGQEAAQKVMQLRGFYEELAGLNAQESQPVDDMGTIPSPIAENPQEMALALHNAAIELGIPLSPEQTNNPNTIDWETLAAQQAHQAEVAGARRIAPMAQAVVQAVQVDEGHPLRVVAESTEESPKYLIRGEETLRVLPENVTASFLSGLKYSRNAGGAVIAFDADGNQIVDDSGASVAYGKFGGTVSDEEAPSYFERGIRVIQRDRAKANGRSTPNPVSEVLAKRQQKSLPYEPDLSQLTLGSRVYNRLEMLRSPDRVLQNFPDASSILKHVEDQYGAEVVAKQPRAAALVEKIANIATVLRSGILSLNSNEYMDARDAMSAAVNDIEQVMVDVVKPNWAPEGPDIEATNRRTRREQYTGGEFDQGFHTGKEALEGRATAREARAGKLSGATPESLSIARNSGATPIISAALEEESAAKDLAPLVRKVVSSLQQLGTRDEKLIARGVLGSQQASFTDKEFGSMVKAHLKREGWTDVLDNIPDEVVGANVRSVGRGLMSSWGLERAMLEAGIPPAEVESTQAVFAAAATQWSKKQGRPVWEFWDRLGDYSVFVDAARSHVLGQASAETTVRSTGWKAFGAAYRFGRGSMLLFSGGTRNLTTPLHEMVHLLETSGLMVEMLDEQAIGDMEKWLGRKLRSASGDPIQLDPTSQEKLAVGFEKFLFENEAPNERLRSAFEQVKSYFREWINEILRSFNTSIEALVLSDLWAKVDSAGTHPAYKSHNVNLQWGDLELNPGMIRAFYMILNANPDGSDIEYHASAGSPGLARALELEQSFKTGTSADGWLTHGTIPANSPNPEPIDWREATGLVNAEADGTYYQSAFAKLQDAKDKVDALASRPMPFSVSNDNKSAKQSVQDALSTEGTLDDSITYEQNAQEMAKIFITGGKDIHYAGEIPDRGNPAHVESQARTFITSLAKWGAEVLTHQNRAQQIRTAALKFKKGTWDLASGAWNWTTPHLANLSQKVEDLHVALGQPIWAQYVNNQHALGRLAHAVVNEIPTYPDPITGDPIQIPGARSLKDLNSELTHQVEQLWENGYKDKIQGRTLKEFFGSVWRDLAIYMVVQRQIEVAENAEKELALYHERVKAWEDAESIMQGSEGELVKVTTSKGDKPKRPKIPHVDPATTLRAKNALRLIRARYGKDAVMFEMAAMERNRWLNLSALVPLLKTNMIDQKQFNDLMAKGSRYVPLNHIKEVLDKSGGMNVRLDESMYAAMDYLKFDATGSVENPLDSMVKKATAVKMLTHRQAGKNALGNRMLKDFEIWDSAKYGITIMSKQVEVSKEEWEKRSKNGSRRVFTKVERKKNSDGTTKNVIHYFAYEPISPEEFKDQKKFIAQEIVKQARKKDGSMVSIDHAEAMVDMGLYTFWPEPGKPMYLYVSDQALAKSLFSMNNPQSVFADSLIGRWKNAIGNPETSRDSMDKALRIMNKLAFQSTVGFTNWSKGMITTSMSFIYNSPLRDLFNGFMRSRHGLSLREWPGAFKESAAVMFPYLRELNPSEHWLAEDIAKGVGAFSGLISQQATGPNDKALTPAFIDAWGTAGRKALLEEAKAGSSSAKRSLMWKDLRAHAAQNGRLYTPLELMQKIRKGERPVRNALLIARSPYDAYRIGMSAIGTILENTQRVGERKRAMAEDMSQYPRLAHLYQTEGRALPGGKVRAGFEGSRKFDRDDSGQEAAGVMGQLLGRSHRAEWERQKKLMAADPEYLPPIATLPVQFTFAERDNSMNHVTLFFSQRGTNTYTMESSHMFFNPSAQDTYTSMMFFGNTSAVRKVIHMWKGEDGVYQPLADQHKYDARALRWLLLGLGYYTFPTLAQFAMFNGDDEEDKEWQSYNFVEKMSYWHIPINGHMVRIANGVGFGSLIFHDLPMTAMMAMWNQDPKAMGKWLDRFLDVTPLGVALGSWREAKKGPTDWLEINAVEAGKEVVFQTLGAPEAIKPWAEIYMNKDQFRNKPVAYPDNMPIMDPTEIARDKFNAVTNRLAKALNMQPKQAQHLIASYLPGIASAVPDALSLGLEGIGAVEDQGSQAVNAPLRTGTTGALPKVFAPNSYGMHNESVQLAYTMLREADGYRNAMKNMTKDRVVQYLAEHPIADDRFYFPLKNQVTNIRNAEDNAKSLILGEYPIDPALNSLPEDQRRKAAMDMRRIYTIQTMELMRDLIPDLAGEAP